MNKTILYVTIFIVVTAILGYYFKTRDDDFVENFDNFSSTQSREETIKIHDQFYSNVYDKLFGSTLKDEFELYNIVNYSIKEDDAEGSALFASSFGDGGYQENVTSKKINVQDIASGTYYWKVITTDNDNSSKSATSYVRKLIIN